MNYEVNIGAWPGGKHRVQNMNYEVNIGARPGGKNTVKKDTNYDPKIMGSARR